MENSTRSKEGKEISTTLSVDSGLVSFFYNCRRRSGCNPTTMQFEQYWSCGMPLTNNLTTGVNLSELLEQ